MITKCVKNVANVDKGSLISELYDCRQGIDAGSTLVQGVESSRGNLWLLTPYLISTGKGREWPTGRQLSPNYRHPPDAVVVSHYIDALRVRQIEAVYEQVEDAPAAKIKLLPDDALQIRHHTARVQVNE